MKRLLGRSGIEISAMGLGTWAIGGAQYRNGEACGWAGTNDEESIRAMQRGMELGITFFDTADIYGSGHSEILLAKAIEGKRDQVVIASKFGYEFEEGTDLAMGQCAEPDYIRQCCEGSLRRLKTDRIELYQFHLGGYDVSKAGEIREVLEELVKAGKILHFGWSTDNPAAAKFFAESPNCTAIQQRLNIFEGNMETLKVCEDNNLASINKGPLAMGILTGKFNSESKIGSDDVRCGWDFKEGEQANRLKKMADLRDILTSDGRTLTQGALAWLWGKSPVTIPIPGFKSVKQVEENAAAMQFGPLTEEQMLQADSMLDL